jgi:hypothetical protein
MNTPISVSLLAAALLLGGCAASRGERQAETPPRLVEGDNKTLLWDRGAAFGPVPLTLASLAALRCAALDTKDQKWQAEGFHAQAQDLQGKTLPGGGYYCKPRKRSS